VKPNWRLWVLISVVLFVIISMIIIGIVGISNDALVGLVSTDSLIGTLAVIICNLPDSKDKTKDEEEKGETK